MEGTYLPLAGEVTVAGGDAEEEGVEGGEGGGVDDGVVGLGRGVEELEDVLGERLGDPARAMSGDGRSMLVRTYWKIVTLPPAASTPAFSASATKYKIVGY